MSEFRDFPAMLGQVVAEVRKEYDQANLAPYFGYGTYFELMEMCKVKDMNQQVKYPLIWLVWEAEEDKLNWIDPYIYTVAPRVYICSFAGVDDSTEQRYANVINPTLYPIFDLLIDELGYHPNIVLGSDFTYPVNDHPFWLRNDAGAFDDLSAIEIKFENLQMFKN